MNTTAQTGQKFNYFFGLINLVAVFCIVWLLWYVFMNPNTVMKLYTPMYGFSLVVGFLAAIVLLNNVAGGYPFPEVSTQRFGPVQRGIADDRRCRFADAFSGLHFFLGIYRQIRHRLFQPAIDHCFGWSGC